MLTTLNETVPKGMYAGRSWAEVPEGYLYFIVNGSDWHDPFVLACRREVIRRRAMLTPRDPWEDERGPISSEREEA